MSEWQALDYHKVNSLQQYLADSSLRDVTLNGWERLLDLGCGDGRITAGIARRLTNGSVLGVDLSHDMIDFARQEYSYPNLSFEQCDARGLQRHGEFDVIVSFNALHWVQEQEEALRGMHRALKSNGRVFLQMVGHGERKSLEHVIRDTLSTLRWAPYFENFHKPYVHYTPTQYRDMATACGFDVQDIALDTCHWDFRTADAFAQWARGTFGAWLGRLPPDRHSDFIEDVLTAYGGNVFHFYQMKISLIPLPAP